MCKKLTSKKNKAYGLSHGFVSDMGINIFLFSFLSFYFFLFLFLLGWGGGGGGGGGGGLILNAICYKSWSTVDFFPFLGVFLSFFLSLWEGRGSIRNA